MTLDAAGSSSISLGKALICQGEKNPLLVAGNIFQKGLCRFLLYIIKIFLISSMMLIHSLYICKVQIHLASYPPIIWAMLYYTIKNCMEEVVGRTERKLYWVAFFLPRKDLKITNWSVEG